MEAAIGNGGRFFFCCSGDDDKDSTAVAGVGAGAAGFHASLLLKKSAILGPVLVDGGKQG